jgi:chromosome segregation ATPase
MSRQCVTHHYACDCREEAHAKEVAELKAKLAELRAVMEANEPMAIQLIQELKAKLAEAEQGIDSKEYERGYKTAERQTMERCRQEVAKFANQTYGQGREYEQLRDLDQRLRSLLPKTEGEPVQSGEKQGECPKCASGKHCPCIHRIATCAKCEAAEGL